MTDSPQDSMLVIAAYFKDGTGHLPTMEFLANRLAQMLTGEMGLFLVYSTDPDGGPVVPAKPEWRVKSAVVNVRSGPSLTASILRQARAGDIFTEKSISGNWVETVQGGWISQSVMERIP